MRENDTVGITFTGDEKKDSQVMPLNDGESQIQH